jgi:hypothetical protein
MLTLTTQAAVQLADHIHNSDDSSLEYVIHIHNYGGAGVVGIMCYEKSENWQEVGTCFIPVDDLLNRSENELNDYAANGQHKAFLNLLESKKA